MAVVLTVLGGHAALLQGFGRAPLPPLPVARPHMASAPAVPVLARAIAPAAAFPGPSVTPSPPGRTQAEEARSEIRRVPRGPQAATGPSTAQDRAGPAVEIAPAALPAPLPALAMAAVAGASTAEAPAVEPVPVYPTRLPPAFALDYELRRGPLGGSGRLSWQPGPPYLLRLEGEVPLFGTVLVQSSQGERDAHGLAPLRFTDRRRGRSETAANFQRDSGRISFSGPSVTYPLLPGAQDRLSWMVQLAAIAKAASAGTAVERISLFVAGSRGDAGVWTFRRQGDETLQVGGEALQTQQWLREPRHPHDTRVEVWLAPGAHHLPVRARMTDRDGEPFELRLERLPGALRE